MKTEPIRKIEEAYVVNKLNFSVGDTIAVKTIIREGDKKRTQIFKGIVIAIKRSGIRKTFTIRKISSGIGVEKIIPLNSPNIESIKIIRRGAVRKSKLYYMRKRIGKRALKINEAFKSIEDDITEELIEEPTNDQEVKEVADKEIKVEETALKDEAKKSE
jgi:large subunit ribosomal protein L19